MDVYETLPIVPLRDVVVFPHMMMPFVIGRPSSTRALEHALTKDKRIFLAAQKDAANDDPNPNDIYTMGCVANIVQSLKLGMEHHAVVHRQRLLFARGRSKTFAV